jgi:hypothetical protein
MVQYRHGLGHRRSLVIIEARRKLVTPSYVEDDYREAFHPSCVALVKKEASERAASNVLLLLTMIGGIFFERLWVHAQPCLTGPQPVLKTTQPCLSLMPKRPFIA